MVDFLPAFALLAVADRPVTSISKVMPGGFSMTRSRTAVAVMMLMSAAHAGAQEAAPAVAPASASAPAQAATTPDAPIRTFLSGLLAGQMTQAVDGLLAASTTPAQKPGERENLLAQLGAAVVTYGPVIAYEKAGAQTSGSMVVRQYYLVQHRDMVVRWEFVLVRTGSGWRVDYFGFDDQPRTWF
jgi:hypothetical protein